MAEGGLFFEGERNDNGVLITHFGILAGREQEAAEQLLSYILAGATVSLRNDLDEGLEGTTCFRKARHKIQRMDGGHGWTTEWKDTNEHGVIAAVAEWAHLNCGGHWSRQGSIMGVSPHRT